MLTKKIVGVSLVREYKTNYPQKDKFICTKTKTNFIGRKKKRWLNLFFCFILVTSCWWSMFNSMTSTFSISEHSSLLLNPRTPFCFLRCNVSKTEANDLFNTACKELIGNCQRNSTKVTGSTYYPFKMFVRLFHTQVLGSYVPGSHSIKISVDNLQKFLLETGMNGEFARAVKKNRSVSIAG